MNVYISKGIINFIKSHAKSSPHEIYGWLIGMETADGDLQVIMPVSCERYIDQHYTHAAPNPLEITEIASSLPRGVGIIGIYHSHPNEVFHSSTDDVTLRNLKRYYPNMISAVTNGNIIKWFNLDNQGKSHTFEIKTRSISMENIKCLEVYSILTLNTWVNLSIPLIPQLTTQVQTNIDKIWNAGHFEIFGPESNSGLKQSITEFQVKTFNQIYSPGNAISISLTFDKSKSVDGSNQRNLINIRGEIPLVCLFTINLAKNSQNTSKKRKSKPQSYLSTKDFSISMEEIKSEMIDDLIMKISRSILSYNTINSLDIVSPRSIILPYLEFPLRIRTILDDISKYNDEFIQNLIKRLVNHTIQNPKIFPDPKRIIESENSSIIAMQKRGISLARTGDRSDALSFLSNILEIYKIRNDAERIKNLNNIINLIENL